MGRALKEYTANSNFTCSVLPCKPLFSALSELVIVSRKHIDNNDGPKSAGQSANYQMTRWVRRISAAGKPEADLSGFSHAPATRGRWVSCSPSGPLGLRDHLPPLCPPRLAGVPGDHHPAATECVPGGPASGGQLIGSGPEWVRGTRSELAAYVRGIRPNLRVVFRANPSANGQYTVGAFGTPIQIEERSVSLTFDTNSGLSGPEVFEGRGSLPNVIGIQLLRRPARLVCSRAAFAGPFSPGGYVNAPHGDELACTRERGSRGGCPAELGLQALDGVDLPVGCRPG